MQIPDWIPFEQQMACLGRHSWSVPRLVQLAAHLPRFEIPLNHLSLYYTYDKLTMRELVMHMRAVREASLTFPIILDEDGEIMDGRHRLMRAMLDGLPSITAVRFDKNPSPCRTSD